jgi:hypothetical protein
MVHRIIAGMVYFGMHSISPSYGDQRTCFNAGPCTFRRVGTSREQRNGTALCEIPHPFRDDDHPPSQFAGQGLLPVDVLFQKHQPIGIKNTIEVQHDHITGRKSLCRENHALLPRSPSSSPSNEANINRVDESGSPHRFFQSKYRASSTVTAEETRLSPAPGDDSPV